MRITAIIDNKDLIKLKSFYTAKETIRLVERERGSESWSVMFLTQDQYPEYLKNSKSKELKFLKDPFEKWAMDLKRRNKHGSEISHNIQHP